MTDHGPAVHRTIVAVDVEGFGNRRRTNPNQLAIRAGLYRAMQEALGQAGIAWEQLYHEDRGDSILILAGPEIPKSLLVESLPSALIDALERHNSTHPRLERIRLRMALHAGEVNFDEHGVTGAPTILTFRLLDCGPVKQALAESPGVLALITSSWFFEQVVRHSTAAAEYYPVRVAVKETVATGWICLLGAVGRRGPTPDQRSWPLPWRRTILVAGLLLAVLVLLAVWVRDLVTHVHLTHPGATASAAPAGPITILTDPESTEVYSAAFSPGGRVLATADLGNVYLRNTTTWRITATLSVPVDLNVSSVAFGGGGSVLAAGDFDGRTYVFSTASGKIVHVLPNPDPGQFEVESVAFSPSGSLLAAAGENGSTYLWSTRTWTLIGSLPDPHPGKYGVESVAFSPDGSMLATGDSNGRAYLWDVATGRKIATLTPPDDAEVTSVAFSPDGSILATGVGLGQDFPFRATFPAGFPASTGTYLWSITNGRRMATLTDPHTGGVNSVAFSPDGKLLASGDANNNTYLRSVSTGKIVAILPDPEGGISSVAFGANGTVLATSDALGASGTPASTYVWSVRRALLPG